MHGFIVLPLLLAAVSAGPVPGYDHAPTGAIGRCEAAPNCETYFDSTGLQRVRFIPGMEPGSADYAHRMNKRDANTHTEITLGDHQISWGCDIDPVQTLNNVSSICSTSGGCIATDSYTLDVQYLNTDPGSAVPAPNSQELVITATGSYPVWMRNGLVQTLQSTAAVPKAINWDRQQAWVNPQRRDTGQQDGQPFSGGLCDIATFTNYIGITVFENQDIQAIMDVSIALPHLQSGFCASAGADALVGSAVSWLGPAGAGAAGFLGTVAATCAIVAPPS